MSNPVELYAGVTRLYRFDPMPQSVDFQLMKSGSTPIDIPGQIRPWMFDFTSQDRTITINATLLNTTYDANTPGTGSILDQLEDLFYIFSGNWTLSSTDQFLTLYVPYSMGFTTSRSGARTLTGYYPTNGNSDYAKDLASIPGYDGTTPVEPVGSSITRAGADKKYYVHPFNMGVNRDEASVNRVKVTMQFKEVEDVIKI